MSPSLYDLDPGPAFPEVVRMVVEIPKGSSNKYEYDRELGAFRLDRVLYSPVHYPGDYGFIPGTLASDGDPMDVLALVEEPSFSGCVVEVRPVGVLNMVDQEQKDQKIIAVLNRDPRYEQVHSLNQIYPHLRREIEHFFNIYKELEGRETSTLGWGDPDGGAQSDRREPRSLLKRANLLRSRSGVRRAEPNDRGRRHELHCHVRIRQVLLQLRNRVGIAALSQGFGGGSLLRPGLVVDGGGFQQFERLRIAILGQQIQRLHSSRHRTIFENLLGRDDADVKRPQQCAGRFLRAQYRHRFGIVSAGGLRGAPRLSPRRRWRSAGRQLRLQ